MVPLTKRHPEDADGASAEEFSGMRDAVRA